MEEKQVLRNFVLIGHVDHGKSTCGGRILVDTGMVTENAVIKAKEEADMNGMKHWWLAYLLDENDEEKRRGKTHEYTIKEIDRGNHLLHMIDVPGHSQFITQMIQGTSKADLVVLICSAKKGELEKGIKGQIYEHLVLSRCMGITNLIIAINKIDTIGFEEGKITEEGKKMINVVSDQLLRIAKKLNYKTIEIIPISALHGFNIVEPVDQQPSLLQLIENVEWNHKEKIESIDTKRFTAKCMFMNIPNIITEGFSGILHSGEVITEFTLTSIMKGVPRPFIKSSDSHYIDVEIEIPIEKKLASYIILRHGDNTIAIGRIQ